MVSAGNAEIFYGAKDMALGVWTGGGTLGAMMDVPGIVSFEIARDADNEELWADEKVLASTITKLDANVSFELGVHDLDIYAALTGNAVVTTGTGATLVDHLPVKSSLDVPLVQVAAAARGVGSTNGTAVGRAYKVRPTSGGGFSIGDQYGNQSFEGVCIDHLGYYFEIEQHAATLAAIGATGTTTIPTGT